METCREYSFSGYVEIGDGTKASVEGVGWITEDGLFKWCGIVHPVTDIDKYEDHEDKIDNQIFELFQIQNRGRLPQVCIDRFESAPLADREPNHNPNSAIGR